MNQPPSVCAVIIAFSRLGLLQEAITALRNQTWKLNQILVIEQGGIPEIQKWLSEQSDLTVIPQPNLGTAGGFGVGLRTAYELGHDWVWLFDDDGIAEPDALAELMSIPRQRAEQAGYLFSVTMTTRGEVQQSCVAAPNPGWLGTVHQDRCVGITLGCWLGMCVSRQAIEKCGLPSPEFFIWHDDIEYTNRISNAFSCYCVVTSRIVHKQSQTALDPFTSSGYFKIKHGVRNQFGLERLQKSSLLKRCVRFGKMTFGTFTQILKRKLPVKSLGWLVKGYFFFPTVPRVQPLKQGVAMSSSGAGA